MHSEFRAYLELFLSEGLKVQGLRSQSQGPSTLNPKTLNPKGAGLENDGRPPLRHEPLSILPPEDLRCASLGFRVKGLCVRGEDTSVITLISW